MSTTQNPLIQHNYPKWLPLVILVVLIGLTTLVYQNHFDNHFHFDDDHTVVNNPAIREWTPAKFFEDPATSSSLPPNRTFRPIVTSSLALDCQLTGEPCTDYNLRTELNEHAFWFHFTSYLWFIIQGVLLFYVFLKIFNHINPHRWNLWLATLGTAWYFLHGVNAETVNYITSRSDIFSTVAVVAALAIYAHGGIGKKFFLYLIPIIIGALAKPLSIMFLPILFFYILYFEWNPKSLKDLFKFDKNFANLALHTGVTALVAIAGAYFILKLTPETYVAAAEGMDYRYRITQPYVLLHYFQMFLYPSALTADTDLYVFENASDPRFIQGILFLIFTIAGIVATSFLRRYRIIAFGLIWFLFANLPTSVVTLSEVMNDHRMFFPMLGLILIGTFIVGEILKVAEEKIVGSKALQIGAFALGAALLIPYTIITLERVEVWDNGLSLWEDTAQKSPENGRALMNYGNHLREANRLDEAEKVYLEASELENWRFYDRIYINLGVLYTLKGDLDKAEYYYRYAVEINPYTERTHFFLGRFLATVSKNDEAKRELLKALEIMPDDINSLLNLMNLYKNTGEINELKQLIDKAYAIYPGNTSIKFYSDYLRTYKSSLPEYEAFANENPSHDNYIELGLRYYKEGQFRKAIEKTKLALEQNPKSALAYNNICSAHIQLGENEAATAACQKALELDPDFLRAYNNLKGLYVGNLPELEKLTARFPSHDSYIDLSLQYYNAQDYRGCIKMAKKALEHDPNSIAAYNNICSAHNALAEWEEAAKACRRALSIDPDYQLAKNNLKFAMDNMR